MISFEGLKTNVLKILHSINLLLDGFDEINIKLP